MSLSDRERAEDFLPNGYRGRTTIHYERERECSESIRDELSADGNPNRLSEDSPSLQAWT